MPLAPWYELLAPDWIRTSKQNRSSGVVPLGAVMVDETGEPGTEVMAR